jgi:MFS transporter, MHS family, citrate/tricarballylate:H+ symporter
VNLASYRELNEHYLVRRQFEFCRPTPPSQFDIALIAVAVRTGSHLNTEATHMPLGKVFVVGIGNALEFYDFLTYSYFAIQIGHCFFPLTQTAHGLLFSLATFGAGFFTRPLGAIVIGRIGDRAGRKPAMVLSFVLMGVGITGLALTPSYASIGIAAPIFLLAFRLLQGFALGGQVGPSTAFLIEAAPPDRRGLYVAVQYVTQDLAVVAAGIVGYALSNWLSVAALDSWGWRLAFLLGAVVVPFGVYLRGTLPETLTAAARETTLPERRRVPPRLLVLGLILLMATTIGGYGLSYMTTFAQDSLRLAAGVAFGATIMNGLGNLIGDLLSGFLSDRIGRKPVMLFSVLMLLVLVLPAYLAMTHFPGALTVYLATSVLCVLQQLFGNAALVTIAESLPTAIRSTVLATLYAVATTAFGGTTQLAIKMLTEATGNSLAPAWYMTGALAVGTVAVILIQETAPIKTGKSTI